jgi:hypothetical protein
MGPDSGADNFLQVDITFDNQAFNPSQPLLNIRNGETAGYQINENFEPFGYDDNTALVRKRFISPDTTEVDNIFSTKNGIVQDFLGGFNDNVNTIEYFFFREEAINLIAIGGKFTTYTKNGTTTNCNLFIILNTDGTVYSSVNYATFIQSGVSVDAIKYHAVNDSLIIGGEFLGVGDLDDLSGLFELDLINTGLSASMVDFDNRESVQNPSGLKTRVTAIGIIDVFGIIIIGGDISEVRGASANRLFVLTSTFTVQLNQFFIKLRNAIDSGLGDFINKIYVKQDGDLQVLVGGLFTIPGGVSATVDTKNLAVFNSQGDLISSFKNTNNAVQDITERNSSYYICGVINKYGTQDVNKIFKVDVNGNLDNSFTFDYDVTAVKALEFGEFGFLYVFFLSRSLSYNFGALNLNTGEIENRLKVLDTVRVIRYLEDGIATTANDLIIGGVITEFETFTSVLNQNEVLIDKSSMANTRDNLFDNLVEENTRNGDLGFQYLKIGNDKIRIEKRIESNEDVYFLSNIKSLDNKVAITVFRNDANLGDTIVNIPIRKDFFIQNIGRNIWSTANFFLTIYQNDFVVSEDNTIVIYKPKIANDQFNQFLNISPLVNQQDFESDIAYYDQLDYATNEPNIEIARFGRFATTKVDTLLGDTVLETKNEFNFVFDGYSEFKEVLLNGNKRKYNRDGKMTIPFLSDKVREIEVINGPFTNTITNPNFENVNPEKPEEYISYLCIDFAEYLPRDTTILKFKRGGNFTIDTLTLFKGTESCLFYSVKVIFKNSFGALEPTYMNGRSIDSVDTDSSKYKRSIRDINGNIQLPLTHTNKTFNKTGSKEWECNTGLVDAYMNDCYEDLFMSEEIWLEIDGVLRAVSLESSNFNKEDDLQTDMINYRFTFKEDRNLNE